MSNIKSFFVTRIYDASLDQSGKKIDMLDLAKNCDLIAEDDTAGQNWCEKNNFPGYTSYASLNDLPWRFPIFKDLTKLLNKHVEDFVTDLQFDLSGKKLNLDSLWINILPPGGVHTSHLHPHSVISGTTYVKVPKESGVIKFEDPRLAMMMAAPTRKEDVRSELKSFVYLEPKVGNIILWESWLRHEVPMNLSNEERVSISFNYSWK
jgi:uncharacterized protein (TIGR02466 family)